MVSIRNVILIYFYDIANFKLFNITKILKIYLILLFFGVQIIRDKATKTAAEIIIQAIRQISF